MSHRLAVIAVLATFGSLATTTPAAEYHVAKDGHDGQAGTVVEPFLTIGKAAAVAVAGDTVTVHTGTYRETVSPANSGTSGQPIVFQAASGETVTLSGAEPITGWTRHAGAVWVADMPGDFFNAATPGDGVNLYDASVRNYADQIFADGRMLALARWPNTAEGCSDILDITRPAKSRITAFISKSTDGTTNWTTGVVDDASLPAAGSDAYAGAEIVFQPNHGGWSWAFSGHVHSSADEGGGTRLTLRSYSSSGKGLSGDTYADKSRYWLWNKFELLDTAGEWYHDKPAGKLYVWMPDSGSPAGRVEARKRVFGFDLSNRSWITVRGFRLFGCTLTTDRDSGGDNIGYQSDGSTRYPWRGAGSVAASSNCVLEELDVAYPTWFTDISGHFFMQWGQSSGITLSGSDHLLRRCRIRWSAGCGVSVIGRRNRVRDCFIEGVACMPNDSSGVNTGGAATTEDHEIARCTIRYTGRSGVTPRGLNCTAAPDAVNDWQSRIHHNEITHFGMQDWDVGGLYAGGDRQWIRIDHNLVHSATTHVDNRSDNGSFTVGGVYLDYAKNAVIHHNAIWDVEWGIHLQNADDGLDVGNMLVYHNTAIVKRSKDSIVYGPFGIVENSSSAHEGTLIRNNLFACAQSLSNYKAIDDFPSATKDHNIAWNGTARSLSELNLTGGSAYPEAVYPTASSTKVVDNGVVVSDVTRDSQTIQAYNDPAAGSAPDIGAFEYGLSPWEAGAPEEVISGDLWAVPESNDPGLAEEDESDACGCGPSRQSSAGQAAGALASCLLLLAWRWIRSMRKAATVA